MAEKSFIGRGWKFPPTFDNYGKGVRMCSDEDDIKESIEIILGTTPGERVMQPDFGCHLKKLVFEVSGAKLNNEIKDMILYALLTFEPRIKDISIEILDDNSNNGTIFAQINYRIITTNTRHNIVYPFYFLEGTNIQD